MMAETRLENCCPQQKKYVNVMVKSILFTTLIKANNWNHKWIQQNKNRSGWETNSRWFCTFSVSAKQFVQQK